MSFEKQVQIYSYTLTLLNLTLRVKFPCRVYLEHQGRSITSEVSPTASNKFIFNQEVSLKNQTDKQHLEIVVQLLTEKGNKYVGGVVRLVESDLVASEGQCMAVPVSKCLDAEALCELRVDQVATSRVIKKGSPKKQPLRSQYHPDPNLLYSSQRPRAQENETKSQFNFPISMARKERLDRSKDRLAVGNSGRLGFRGGESRIDKEVVGSIAGGPAPSALQFEVYKEGYNKLKEKYRKQTENARSQMNKRLALENSENNLKLQAMRYKLKSQELEKTVIEKSIKIKELTQVITSLQMKQLDSKYLKEEVENKDYSIKSLQETIKSLNRDNNQLKALQSQRFQTQQETIHSLRDQVEKVKKGLESRESELLRQIKVKNEQISKLEYSLHNRSQQLERAKCNIQDLDKAITSKTFEWEKVLQSERNAFKVKQDELKQKIASLQSQRTQLSQQITQQQQALQDKKGEVTKLEYDRKVITQNSEVLIKENQQLKIIKERYIELVRQHKIVNDDKYQLEKNKEREAKIKDAEIFELNQKLKSLTESNKKSVKDLQEKIKANQLKLIQNESQSESLRNQLDRFKRQLQTATKDGNDLKSQLKDCRTDIKAKEETILSLTNQLSNASSKTNQGEQTAKLEIARLKQQVDKLSKALREQTIQSNQYADTISELELAANKSKMEWQFREDKALKELGYSKEKVASLQAFRTDMESQITTFTSTISNLKINEKNLSQKIQRLQLQAIKTKENSEKLKKEIKILQEKLHNNDLNLKARLKEISELQIIKEKIEKRVVELEAQTAGLKNELSQQIMEKQRHQKIGQILQNDIAKVKEEQARLNSIIGEKEAGEVALREELKKEKEQYTKLDMKLNALRKQFEKFKETLVDNLNTVFSSIPEGLNGQMRQVRSTVTDKSAAKENSEVLSLLMGLGREARLNMTRTVDQLKQAIRDNEKLNSDYSTSMNKSNTAEFEFSQAITQLQEEMAELLQEKTKDQNKYEEEIFLLEGRLKEKDASINDLTEQLEELDFLLKNIKTEFELYRQQSQKKDSAKNKLIEELREQIEYQCAEIENLQHNIEKYQQGLEAAELELSASNQTVQKLTKEVGQANDKTTLLEESVASLKKELKRAIERGEEFSMGVAHKQEELRKNEQTLQEEERKSSQLREFLKGLMRQKEEIIKNQLEKSEKVLELETSLQEVRHQLESLEEAYKKSKILQQDSKETIKKLTKNLKDQQTAKLEQKARGNKLSDRLKDKEKEIAAKDDIISKLEDRLKKEADKKAKDVKQLQAQLDQTYQKLLTAQRQSCQQILSLENLNEKYANQNQKLTESLIFTEESLFKEKTKSEQLREKLAVTEKALTDREHEAKGLTAKIQSLNEELRVGEEESFKLQGKINLLQMKFEMKESEGRDSLQNLNDDWSSKYYSMEEEYEQRLQLAEKERDYLKDKLAESDKEIKKLANDLRTQEAAISGIKKNCEDKVKSLEEDRLAAIAQKNIENQRLVDEVRTSFDALKLKESECRKINSQLELLKANLAKVEGRWREGEEKIRNLNRSYQAESEEMRKKEQTFKRIKESVASSVWKAQRQVRKLIQNNARQVIELVDEKNTIRVMEVSRVLEQSILAAVSFKIDEKEA